MSRDEEDRKKLEQLVDSVLRGQPLRRAPLTLEARVMAQLEARPWWRKSFLHWPLAARTAFLIASYGFIRLAIAGAVSIVEALRSGEVLDAMSPVMTWVRAGSTLFSAMGSLAAFLARTVPMDWIYGGLALAIALYVALFGLGTIAYRTLYTNK